MPVLSDERTAELILDFPKCSCLSPQMVPLGEICDNPAMMAEWAEKFRNSVGCLPEIGNIRDECKIRVDTSNDKGIE